MDYIALLFLGFIIIKANNTMNGFITDAMANSGLTSPTMIFDEEVPSLAGKNTARLSKIIAIKLNTKFIERCVKF